MIVKTERILAEDHTNKLKQILQESHLNYILWENPFTVNIRVKKRFFLDYSKPQCESSTPISTTGPFTPDSGIHEISKIDDELFNFKKKLEEKNVHVKKQENEIANNNKNIKDLKNKMEEKDRELRKIEQTNLEEENTKRALKILIEKGEKGGMEKEREIQRLTFENEKLQKIVKEKESEDLEKKREEELEKKANKKRLKKERRTKERRIKAMEDKESTSKDEKEEEIDDKGENDEKVKSDDATASEDEEESEVEEESEGETDSGDEEDGDGDDDDDEEECTDGNDNDDEAYCPGLSPDGCHVLVIAEPQPLTLDEPPDIDCSLCSRHMEPGEAILACAHCRFEKCSECIRGQPGSKTDAD